MNTWIWLFRREIWENRAIWMLPVVVAGLLLVIVLFGHIQVDELSRDLSSDQLRLLGPLVVGGIGMSTLFLIMNVYISWYLLDCLYADRKDRSVLFWKSLPITDTQTVLSKLAMAMLVIPLVYFIVADLTVIAASLVLSVRGGSHVAQALWHPGDWLQLQVLGIYAILTGTLWFLPISAWFMFVSSWARRAVTLWALLLPLAACYVESKLVGSTVLWKALVAHLTGYGNAAFEGSSGCVRHTVIGTGKLDLPCSLSSFIDPAGFFGSGEMWLGFVIGAALVGATIYMRHRFPD